MEDAERYAVQACEEKRSMAEAHFQLARIMLNRRNFSGAWQAASGAIARNPRYADRLPIDSEFLRNAAEINAACGQYAKDLRDRIEAAAQSAAATMHELARSQDTTNRMLNSRAMELLDEAGQGLSEAKARIEKMTGLARTLGPEAEKSLSIVQNALGGNSVLLLGAEQHAHRANNCASRALAASREACRTLQKIEELSKGLRAKPKIFIPDCLMFAWQCAGALISLFFVLCLIFTVGCLLILERKDDISKDIPYMIGATLLSLGMAVGSFWSMRHVGSKAGYLESIQSFDWHEANAPQTTAWKDATALGSDRAELPGVERGFPDGVDPDSLEGQVVSLLLAGQPLEAVQLYMQRTHCDSQAARKFVDAVALEHHIDQYALALARAQRAVN
jgi:tetratricopeptide (TPR) repeat protein